MGEWGEQKGYTSPFSAQVAESLFTATQGALAHLPLALLNIPPVCPTFADGHDHHNQTPVPPQLPHFMHSLQLLVKVSFCFSWNTGL